MLFEPSCNAFFRLRKARWLFWKFPRPRKTYIEYPRINDSSVSSGILSTQPIDQIEVGVEKFSIVEWKIGVSNDEFPSCIFFVLCVVSRLWFQSGHGTRIFWQKYDFIVFLTLKFILEKYSASSSVLPSPMMPSTIFPGSRSEKIMRIFACEWLNFFLQWVYQAFYGDWLPVSVSHIGTKATDKLFEFLSSLLSFFVLHLLTECKLTRFIAKERIVSRKIVLFHNHHPQCAYSQHRRWRSLKRKYCVFRSLWIIFRATLSFHVEVVW